MGIENNPSERKRVRSYFNPERDYVREKYELRIRTDSGAFKSDSTEVLEYAKTPGGRWYPHRVRKVQCSERETDPVVNYWDDGRAIAPKLLDGTKITVQDLQEPDELAKPHTR